MPFGLLDSQAPALVPNVGGSPHTICLVGDGTLRATTRRLDADASTTAIVRSLTQDVADDEAARGLRSALSSDVKIRSASLHRGTAIVDFATAPDLVGQDRILAIAQIVCTLAHQPGIGQISFTVDGEPVQVPIGDGSLTSDPVSVDDYTVLAVSPA